MPKLVITYIKNHLKTTPFGALLQFLMWLITRIIPYEEPLNCWSIARSPALSSSNHLQTLSSLVTKSASLTFLFCSSVPRPHVTARRSSSVMSNESSGPMADSSETFIYVTVYHTCAFRARAVFAPNCRWTFSRCVSFLTFHLDMAIGESP